MSIENKPVDTSPDVIDDQPKQGRLQRFKRHLALAASIQSAIMHPPKLPPEIKPVVGFDETGTIVRHDLEPHLVGTKVAGLLPPDKIV